MSAQRAINVRSKVSALQSKLFHAAKQSLDRRFGALYDKIYCEDVIAEAWKRVRANKGCLELIVRILNTSRMLLV
jgi:RNA-directed DNA polymerase